MKENMKKQLEKLGIKPQSLIFLAGLAGILLIAFAQLPAQAKKKEPPGASSPAQTEQSYEAQLEGRLERILGSISGVGRVQVMVTLESGYGYEYARENKTGSDRSTDLKQENGQKTQEKNTNEEKYVMVEASGGGEAPLITKELPPQVKGVVVVCDGGENPATVSSIIDTVKVAVHLSSAQISVSRMG